MRVAYSRLLPSARSRARCELARFRRAVRVVQRRLRLRGGLGPVRSGCGRLIAANPIIRYAYLMRTMTATEASRRFSDLLDAIERGETVTITRGHHAVAEIGPARRRTGADLRAALDGTEPPDGRFAEDIDGAVGLLTTEDSDPWADA
jgi:antitoxin (DNA-binding transcriptional repressor) of toxin-antitoxin stability system